jgi:hypothetical protein
MNSMLEFVMGNPVISEIGIFADAIYSVLALLTAGLCIFNSQQIYVDPNRVAPWCHVRRFGLAMMTVMMIATAFRHGGHEHSLFQALAVFGLFCFMLGNVYARDSQTGAVKRNNDAAPRVQEGTPAMDGSSHDDHVVDFQSGRLDDRRVRGSVSRSTVAR